MCGQACLPQKRRLPLPAVTGQLTRHHFTSFRGSACSDVKQHPEVAPYRGLCEGADLQVRDSVLDDGHAAEVLQAGLVPDVAVHEDGARGQVQQDVGLRADTRRMKTD